MKEIWVSNLGKKGCVETSGDISEKLKGKKTNHRRICFLTPAFYWCVVFFPQEGTPFLNLRK